MTTTTTTPAAPAFRTHSRLGHFLRDLSVVAICAAIVGTFLVEYWHAPAPASDELSARTPVVAPARG
jgi:hypothetical protein